jgi:hypothetical protein
MSSESDELLSEDEFSVGSKLSNSSESEVSMFSN